MWHSTDSGKTFTKITAVDEGDAIGFGKAAPGASYPAIYTSSKINGVRGIFRSIDAGATWVRLNDDKHQWGWTGSVVIGDPDVYGRVYVGTNGRGVIVGNLTGTDPTTSPTPTPTVTTTPTPTPTVTTPTPTPTPTPTHDDADAHVDADVRARVLLGAVHDERLEHRLHRVGEDHQRRPRW